MLKSSTHKKKIRQLYVQTARNKSTTMSSIRRYFSFPTKRNETKRESQQQDVEFINITE